MKTLGSSLSTLLLALTLVLPVAAAEQTLLLDIKGMHCSGCATGISAMLKRVDGVTRADVTFEDREARVEYDPARTTPEKIIEAVEKLGYKARRKK